MKKRHWWGKVCSKSYVRDNLRKNARDFYPVHGFSGDGNLIKNYKFILCRIFGTVVTVTYSTSGTWASGDEFKCNNNLPLLKLVSPMHVVGFVGLDETV